LMSTKKHRAQLLLEPGQHEALAEIAGRRGESISRVVREAVAEYLARQEGDALLRQRLAALERIRAHRAAVLKQHGGKPLEIDVVELIRQMREGRAGGHRG